LFGRMGLQKHVAFRKLNRTASHRRAMFRTMTTQLIKHERIRTTLPKAKELRRYAEKLVTIVKTRPLSRAKRLAGDYLFEREVVDKLLNVLKPRYRNRPGGYTRILKCGFRKFDKAPMAFIEYVDSPQELGKRLTHKQKPKMSLSELDAKIAEHYAIRNGVVTPISNIDILTEPASQKTSVPQYEVSEVLKVQATEGFRGLLNRRRN